MARHHRDRFSFDTLKRAAKVRSRRLGEVLKELLANSLDAQAAHCHLTCVPAANTRRDKLGLRAFKVSCADDGRGCDEPELLRRIGSTTHDLHAETRGRFGQGLIDVLVISDEAEIRTLKHRLVFGDGCKITSTKHRVHGMQFEGVVRHSGEGLDQLESYFDNVIVPEGVVFTFNGRHVAPRRPKRVISNLKLQTVLYDSKTERVRHPRRVTSVEIHPQIGGVPMIYELGIAIDTAPWELPYDINVLQKTPLDTERNMLPDNYKRNLISLLTNPMSGEYVEYMAEHKKAPAEIKDDRERAILLTDEAKERLVKTVVGVGPEQIVRRNPLDKDDRSESQELESIGFVPINRGTLPSGVSEILADAATVANTHDEQCKAHFRDDPDFPPETERQRLCMSFYSQIATALVGKPVICERVRGGAVAAAYGGRKLSLNIDVNHIWVDPMGEQSLGLIIHECAHENVAGHGVDFRNEVERIGGRLAVWVGEHIEHWSGLRESLCGTMALSE